MAEITQIQVGNITYDIVDNNALHTTYAISGVPADLGIASHGSATTAARSDHIHNKPSYGNIDTNGAITFDTAVGSGDKIVVTDNSISNKLIRTEIVFDGSTTTKALTPKGTWETFTNTKYITLTTSIKSILTEEPISIKQIKSWTTGILPTLGNNIEVINNISFSTGTLPTFSVENNALIISAGNLPELISTTVNIPNIIDIGTLPELISEDVTITNVTTTTKIITSEILEV